MSAFLTSRRLRWLLVVAASLSAIGLFLLATATENSERFARGYDTLVVINIATVALLMFIVGWQLRRLRRSYTRGVFGSRLAVRLVDGDEAVPREAVHQLRDPRAVLWRKV